MKRVMGPWLVTVLIAALAHAAPQQIASVEGMTEHRLDNGMRLLLYPDPTRPMVTVNLTVFVGSRHEGYGEAGMAHLLEHMLFKGTPTHPRFDKLMAERGARWNGTTDLDRTNYFETLIATDENLEFAIKLEADRLVNCPIKSEDLATEMTVVRNEFERSENDPAQVLIKKVLAAAYEWHNYGKSVIGNRSDIERVPADALRRFYQKHYQPDNAMLIVAGKFDEAKALALAEKYFGAIPKPSRVLEQTYTEEPPQDGERSVTLKRVGIVGGVGMLYHVPAGAHEDFAAVDVLRGVLADSPSGEMYKALVEGKKAASIFGWAEAAHDPGFIAFGAVVRPDQSIEEARKTMLAVIDAVMDKGVSEEQVKRVKQRFAAQRKRQIVDTTRVAVELSNWASMGDWRIFFLMRDRVEQITPKDVQAAAKKYLRASNRTVGVYQPTLVPDRTPVPPAPNVAELFKDYKGRDAVAAGEQLDPDPLKIETRVQRPNPIGGVKVALLPKKTRQEMVNLELTLRYGNQENLRGKRTAAAALPELMARGTKKLSYQQLRDALDEHEATLSAGGAVGEAQISLQVPRKHLAGALELLRQVLREPALAESEMEVLRREKLADLERIRTEPQLLAPNLLERKLHRYANDDVRYTPTIEEQIELIKALRLDEVRSVYEQYLSAAAGELAVVGDFEPEPTLDLLRPVLEGWTAAMPYARIVPQVPSGIIASVESIATPDKANANYYAGLALPLQDNHADYPALLIANQVLGGNSSARLWQRVREKEGLSYGVGSFINASSLEPYTQIRMYAICNPANMQKVRVAIAEEVSRLLAEGAAAEEVERAKAAILQRRTMDRTREPVLASTLAEHLLAGRTMKFEAELDEKIKALTLAQVNTAANKYLDPARIVTVVAGDFAKSDAAKSDEK